MSKEKLHYLKKDINLHKRKKHQGSSSQGTPSFIGLKKSPNLKDLKKLSREEGKWGRKSTHAKIQETGAQQVDSG